MKKTILAGMAAAALAVGAQASAGIGVDVSVGTPGIGGYVHVPMTPFVTLRGGVNFLEFELDDQEFDDIEYDADLAFTQVGGFVDVHPFANGFTLTGGALFGERSIDLSATPTSDIEIGDETFTAEEVGELVGGADFGDFSYYAGFGWDSTTHGLSPVSFIIRAGVIITDSPTVTLFNEGGSFDPLIQAELNAELERERQELENDIEDFRFYPVLSIGLGFGF